MALRVHTQGKAWAKFLRPFGPPQDLLALLRSSPARIVIQRGGAATKGDEKQPRIDTNVRPLFASIRVHSRLEESSGIRAILNVGTAKITAGHSLNQKGPGKNRE